MAATRAEVFVPESFNLEDKDKQKLKENVRKIRRTRTENTTGRGVIYLGHIPNGFFEPQMKQFFSQFGRVTRLRLSRSKKTGRSKGYAFVEFFHKEVAEVVAATMNNYLMFMRLLKCELLPPEKVHPDTFKGCNRKFSGPKAAAVAAQRHNAVKTKKQERKARNKQARKLKKLSKLLNPEAGKEEKVGDSPVPDVVNTPSGKLHVLKEDASDTEITFRTPPGAIKSSRLAATPKTKTKKRKRV